MASGLLTSAGLATGHAGCAAMEPTRGGGGGGAAMVWAMAAALERMRIRDAVRRWRLVMRLLGGQRYFT